MRVLELKVPPPIVALVTAVLMWLISRSLPPLFTFVFPARNAFAIGLVAAGFIIGILGVVTFRRAKTTVNPTKPQSSSSLVSWGVYRVTRNPMYLGGLLILIGWAIFLSKPIAFLFLPGYILYINLFQIVPEERVLSTLFGPDFIAYKSRARRWL
jgi:protein-S-isoprenylcysteine O-methyltransferase Ste14